MKNVFDSTVTNELIGRVQQLNSSTQPKWGKMSVGQMLAHCNVAYEMALTDKHPRPGAIKRFIIKTFIKQMVVGEKPYAKNGRTAPEFLITEEKDFTIEQKRLIGHLNQVQELGSSHFNNKESHAMGRLTTQEWNNMFYKHLNHHLEQFGV